MKKQSILATIIYNECIEWCVDYLENEISFDSFSIRFLTQSIKLHEEKEMLFHQLSEAQKTQLQEIEELITKRVTTIHEKDLSEELKMSEETLKEKLLEVIRKS